MDFTTLLITGIPTIGSILVAFFANNRSRKAELRALEIEAKAASRDDFTSVTGAYQVLFETAQAEIDALRARILHLEQIIMAQAGLYNEVFEEDL